eukprot:3228809-Prymnesium_polylepis.1
MSGVDRRPAKEGEEVGENQISVCPYYMEHMHGLGERVLRARAVLGNVPLPRLLCGFPRSNATNAVPPPMCPRVPCD